MLMLFRFQTSVGLTWLLPFYLLSECVLEYPLGVRVRYSLECSK